MKKWIALFLASSVGVSIAAQSSPTVPAADGEGSQGPSQRPELPLTSKTLFNAAAYIPPQCYTKTQDKQGRVHNPCFTCHTTPRRPNYTGDAGLQRAYEFAETSDTNHWKNLFRDRSQAVAGISDEDIRDHIRRSNYFDEQGRIKLATRLANVPREWDYNGNGQWDGFVPDAWFDFDAQGFDRDPEGHYTGWRAFAYYPFPGTFWPANGSTDDVLIRLSEAFRTGLDGKYEYSYYLELNGAGDEFRENDEILNRFFTSDGKPDPAELRRLRTDISLLLFASERRAMTLNKAYWSIVREQRFIDGRDAPVKPVGHVHEKIKPGTSTGVERAVLGY
jgi:hypothetical protein